MLILCLFCNVNNRKCSLTLFEFPWHMTFFEHEIFGKIVIVYLLLKNASFVESF